MNRHFDRYTVTYEFTHEIQLVGTVCAYFTYELLFVGITYEILSVSITYELLFVSITYRLLFVGITYRLLLLMNSYFIDKLLTSTLHNIDFESTSQCFI